MQAFYAEGRYKAEVVNQALGKNQKGTPQFVLKCRIMFHVEGDVEKNVRQYERSIFMYLSEAAAPYTIDKLKDIGFSGASIRQLDLSQANAHSFIGQTLDLDCRHEESQDGETREKWDLAFGGSGEIEITPLDAQETRKLDALFGKSLGASAPAATRTATRNTVAAPVAVDEQPIEITDDDIPF